MISGDASSEASREQGARGKKLQANQSRPHNFIKARRCESSCKVFHNSDQH